MRICWGRLTFFAQFLLVCPICPVCKHSGLASRCQHTGRALQPDEFAWIRGEWCIRRGNDVWKWPISSARLHSLRVSFCPALSQFFGVWILAFKIAADISARFWPEEDRNRCGVETRRPGDTHQDDVQIRLAFLFWFYQKGYQRRIPDWYAKLNKLSNFAVCHGIFYSTDWLTRQESLAIL